MKSILSQLFNKSIEHGVESFSQDQIDTKWLGNPAATNNAIETIEIQFGVKFPQDYIDLLLTSNGFPSCDKSIEPSFHPIEKIIPYKNYQWNCIDDYKAHQELKEHAEALERAILIAGAEEEQQFVLIPPDIEKKEWKYWKMANWIPGEEEYESLSAYLQSVINFLKEV